MLMLNVVTTALTALPVWLVQLGLDLGRDGRVSVGDAEVEPMVELLYRTDGVRSVAVVPLETGLAAAVGIAAPNATVALVRARRLVVSCARRAGLDVVAVPNATVIPAPGAETA
jgi:hypothetical protein